MKEKKKKKTDYTGHSRLTWGINPVTRVKKSGKVYDRKRDRKKAIRDEWC